MAAAARVQHAALARRRVASASRTSARRGVAAATGGGAEPRSSKAPVTLGPYTGGALVVTARPAPVSPAEVEARLAEKQNTTHHYRRVNFTGSGAALGHTVRVNFKARYAAGDKKGQPVPGTEAEMYELELDAEKHTREPWKAMVNAIVENGMGQEESKTFAVTFPRDYAVAALKGVEATFTLTVKEIGIMEAVEADARDIEVQRAEVEAELVAAAERAAVQVQDAEIKTQLLETSLCDTQKIEDSVSWAKFGPRSRLEMKWNLIMEEVARQEGIDFGEVKSFLRVEARYDPYHVKGAAEPEGGPPVDEIDFT